MLPPTVSLYNEVYPNAMPRQTRGHQTTDASVQNQNQHPTPVWPEAVNHSSREGYFMTRNFIPYPQAQNARLAPMLNLALDPIINSGYSSRYLEEAGFTMVRENPEALSAARKILKASCLVLGINNVQWPNSAPSRLYRVNAELNAYLNDRPNEMQLFHVLGVSPYEADNFQRLISKLLWSIGAQSTYLNHQEQEAFLRSLIDASLAPLKAVLMKDTLKTPLPTAKPIND
jgi:hypothetical protein